MTATPSPSEVPPAPVTRRPRLTRNQKIGLGVLLTFVGLAFLAVLFPSSPDQLRYAIPVAAVGILALWVGGILMGIGSRS